MKQVVIENPVIDSPYSEPVRRFRFVFRDVASVFLGILFLVTPLDDACAGDDGTHFVIHFAGAPNVWSEMTVTTREGGHAQSVVTRFIPNRVNAELRYFPARFQGEIIAVPLEGIHVTDEEVVKQQDGVYRPATPSDPKEEILLLTRTFALDSRGRVTFFHGVIRAPGVGDVLSHLVWGYPPETSLQEAPSSGISERGAK